MRQLASKGGTLAPHEQMNIATQTADAMQSVHALRIVHRDLSARNVLVAATTPIVVKLADFGCTILFGWASNASRPAMQWEGNLTKAPRTIKPRTQPSSHIGRCCFQAAIEALTSLATQVDGP